MNVDEILGKIKSYADMALDQVGKAGKAAASKTENTVSKAKIKFAIGETEGKIKAIYEEIGKKMYESYLENGAFDDELKAEYEKVDALNEELDELNLQISELKAMVKCDSCGSYNKNDSEYCSKCGSKLAEEQIVEDAQEEAEEINSEE